MPIPDFVKTLRAKIGRDPLPLVGVTTVVFDEQGRVLLVRRADNRRWTLVSGIVEPGEQPAAAAVREIARCLDLALADDPAVWFAHPPA